MTDGRPHRLAAIVFPGFETLDLFGPLEMFGSAADQFSITVVGEAEGAVNSRHGQGLVVDRTLADPDLYDMVLVPGGPGTPVREPNLAINQWLLRQAEQASFVMSVCTGSALLAQIGLLDGRRATTNKMAFAWVRGFGPKVDWVAKARWVEDGQFFTSSGVSAGMDMALAVIQRIAGPQAAEHVALFTEYDWHRDPDWDPFAALAGLQD